MPIISIHYLLILLAFTNYNIIIISGISGIDCIGNRLSLCISAAHPQLLLLLPEIHSSYRLDC